MKKEEEIKGVTHYCEKCGNECYAGDTELCKECWKKDVVAVLKKQEKDEEKSQDTNKEIGKWLWDVAKYVTTAIIITTFLGNFEDIWRVYLSGFIIAGVCFVVGYYFISNKK